MNALTGDYYSMAEAVGEYERADGHTFIPGDDFDPYDDHDVEAVMLVGEQDRYARDNREVLRLRSRVAALHARLAELDPDFDTDDADTLAQESELA